MTLLPEPLSDGAEGDALVAKHTGALDGGHLAHVVHDRVPIFSEATAVPGFGCMEATLALGASATIKQTLTDRVPLQLGEAREDVGQQLQHRLSARAAFRGILTNSLELDPPASSSPSRAVTT